MVLTTVLKRPHFRLMTTRGRNDAGHVPIWMATGVGSDKRRCYLKYSNNWHNQIPAPRPAPAVQHTDAPSSRLSPGCTRGSACHSSDPAVSGLWSPFGLLTSPPPG